MIDRIVLRRFKRFQEVTLQLPGHVVLAGPNNMGKTTLLQAVAAWDVAFSRWKELNDWKKHRGGYSMAPLARLAFSAVPLRTFDLLFLDRRYKNQTVEIEVSSTGRWTATMEFHAESTEQVYVRPKSDVTPEVLRTVDLRTVFVPPMSGLGTAEPVYQSPKIEQLLGQGKPGDVIRNLLLKAHQNEDAWRSLCASIKRLFGARLLPPDGSGPDIVAEYQESSGISLDVASAGSGFQQVLMLLTFLHTRPGSLLLLDEPDAHLHVILQDAIYGELKAVAAEQKSQLVIATHSEVILEAADVSEVFVLFEKPRPLVDEKERKVLTKALAVLSHTDIMEARLAPGVLYTEDHTDLEVLRAWAKVLGHPALETLTTRLFWRKTVIEPRAGASGIRSKEHFEALSLVRADLPGLELLDGDARPDIPATEITGRGLQRFRWKRYEIESYLFHPAALARFVEYKVGPGAAPSHGDRLLSNLRETQPPAFLTDPLGDHAFLKGVKARTDLLPPALSAGGLPGFRYTAYHEIAALMKPEEIHPDVIAALDSIQRAFRL